jgi:UDP-N-acetylglucosamine 2-epimerase (non-hydrolysing)
MVAERKNLKIVYPIHPRTRKVMQKEGINLPEGVLSIDPLGYFDFLNLEMNASLILTDSGGVQEEACTLHVPCVTLRTTTERPETVEVGANIVAGVVPSRILKCASMMLSRKRTWRNPLGNGNAAERIASHLLKRYGE